MGGAVLLPAVAALRKLAIVEKKRGLQGAYLPDGYRCKVCSASWSALEWHNDDCPLKGSESNEAP